MRIIHLLNWNLNDITTCLDYVANQNFNAIQITPVQPMKEECIDNWWMPFQPISFDIGNCYGSKEDLEELCYQARLRDIDIYVDVICNHMAGKNDGSLSPHEKVDPYLRNNPYFWKEARPIENWDDRYQVTNYCMGLPGLNVSNPELQEVISAFLNKLVDCGVEGFRFDAAKSIGLPSEGVDFWPNTIYSLQKYGLFLYGEVIFAPGYITDQYRDYIKILSNENPPSNEVVSYSESHDSYYEFGYTKHKCSQEIIGDYNRLTDNYEHTLFFPRPFDNSWMHEEVKQANRVKILRR